MPSNGQVRLAPFHFLERVAPSVPGITSIEKEIHRALSELALAPSRLRGKRIGVSAGSRGIASLADIVRGICGWLKARGADPFVFPAMGSHGGATAEGQQKVLTDYGVTAENVGAEVRSSMETVSLGAITEGAEVFMDRHAWEADGIVVFNRVKPHTDFSGSIESGLLKMIAVGMGKAEGARETHRWGRKVGPERVIRAMSAVALESGKILCGLGVVENEFHQIAAVRAAGPEGVVSMEETLLVEAKRLVARLPFQDLHVLIVDEMGKNISGTGMDTKIIGRGANFPVCDVSDIRLIYVRDLTASSAGNALGVGLADVIHDRLYNKIDMAKTYVNVRTSLNPPMARLPIHLPSDRQSLDFALGALGSPGEGEQRIVWIRNTLDLNRVAVSPALAREAERLSGWRLSERERLTEFGAEGDLESRLSAPET
jgi:Lactate racemase N-terminal domain